MLRRRRWRDNQSVTCTCTNVRTPPVRATVIHGPNDIRVEEVPDAAVRTPPTPWSAWCWPASAAATCGRTGGWPSGSRGSGSGTSSSAWSRPSAPRSTSVRVGDLVVAPFVWSDGICDFCREGLHTSCPHGGFWGSSRLRRRPGRGRARPVRRRHPGRSCPPRRPATTRLLTAPAGPLRRDGHRAPRRARRPGPPRAPPSPWSATARSGLCGVLAAKRLGAEQIIALGRHTARTDIARSFGATDVVAERGEAAIAAVRELTKGQGAHAVLEAVGTEESMRTAISIARDGGAVGYVGVPHGGSAGVDIGQMFGRNVTARRRRRPGPRLHPGAAGRRAGRRHRPVPGLRPLGDPRRGAGRLPGDGRAHRAEGPHHVLSRHHRQARSAGSARRPTGRHVSAGQRRGLADPWTSRLDTSTDAVSASTAPVRTPLVPRRAS